MALFKAYQVDLLPKNRKEKYQHTLFTETQKVGGKHGNK